MAQRVPRGHYYKLLLQDSALASLGLNFVGLRKGTDFVGHDDRSRTVLIDAQLK